ncbi:hypothetical protein H2200_006993 [Cladophialophora chaetospira]|uniref:Uncharacterized protein n=1 Tax=Cladophialophora chaetospira TaxID=386627 RepID=A0AA39CIG7_9EURO|nr:hypothetical protein H2200_006993 [Cladophialophora chaetospira]
MQVFITLLALVAPIAATSKHVGRGHVHPLQRRQVLGLGVLASPAPAGVISTASSITPTISSYLFPTSVIQVPVATVCPDTPATSALFSIPPMSSLLSMGGFNGTRDSGDSATQYLPVQINATAFLPNGSTTVFLSTTSTMVIQTSTPPLVDPMIDPSSDILAAETARIIFGSDGCQTVYSAKTTAQCSTTIKPVGILPVPITDCEQWVTFSSQRLKACSASPTPDLSSAGVVDGPMEYYVAHWSDLLRGPIPTQVLVEDCLPKSTGMDCITSSESWDVTTSTTVTTGTSVASFEGPAVITVGTFTLTTTLSFESTATTTAVVTSSAIERHRLGTDTASTSTEQTVTVLVTMPMTRTLSLDSVAVSTVTVQQTSTLQVTETRTRSLSDAVPTVAAA